MDFCNNCVLLSHNTVNTYVMISRFVQSRLACKSFLRYGRPLSNESQENINTCTTLRELILEQGDPKQRQRQLRWKLDNGGGLTRLPASILSNATWFQRAIEYVLPAGFPASVSASYLGYAKWSTMAVVFSAAGGGATLLLVLVATLEIVTNACTCSFVHPIVVVCCGARGRQHPACSCA
jgi:hypothetical protein